MARRASMLVERPSTARGQETRGRVLQAAMELLWTGGFGSMTIDQVCEAAGVRKGSFYRLFDSKASLAAAALDYYWHGRQPVLDELFSVQKPGLRRLEDYFESLRAREIGRKRSGEGVRGCPYFHLCAEVSASSAVVAAKAREMMARLRRYFESALRDAASEGAIRVDDVAGAATMLFTYFEGCLTQARIHNEPALLEGLLENGLRLVDRRGGALVSRKVLTKASKN